MEFLTFLRLKQWFGNFLKARLYQKISSSKKETRSLENFSCTRARKKEKKIQGRRERERRKVQAIWNEIAGGKKVPKTTTALLARLGKPNPGKLKSAARLPPPSFPVPHFVSFAATLAFLKVAKVSLFFFSKDKFRFARAREICWDFYPLFSVFWIDFSE